MSNDRLKFRAYVEDFCFNDEDGNEYKKSFMINNVAVFGGCLVGTYVNELTEQLKEQSFTDDEVDQILEGYSYYCENEDWFNFDADFVERYTGLNDKNGNLVYEGDIIRFISDKDMKAGISEPKNFGREHFFVVTYKQDDERFQSEFYLENIKGYECPTHLYNFGYEVVGNIHENKDLLK